MKKFAMRGVLAGAAFLVSGSAYAACTAPELTDDLTEEQIVQVYDCIREDLRAGYAKGDNAWAKEYFNWGATATRPAAPGTHSGRFLFTFVNEIGLEEYNKYPDEREENPMPVGTVIAIAGYAYGVALIRCPDCGARWFWDALMDPDVYKAVFTGDACPKCQNAVGGLLDENRD